VALASVNLPLTVETVLVEKEFEQDLAVVLEMEPNGLASAYVESCSEPVHDYSLG
jgi:hypothetical protein